MCTRKLGGWAKRFLLTFAGTPDREELENREQNSSTMVTETFQMNKFGW